MRAMRGVLRVLMRDRAARAEARCRDAVRKEARAMLRYATDADMLRWRYALCYADMP